ncbi:MAG: DGQHR domain-containing protein, partial [Gammaproteobacteria bacterium]|nr:DGQHR domain-containing protein [Gammaproteobacteria bacterium]
MYVRHEEYLGPVVSGEEIKSDLRHRKKKDVYKTVSGSSKQLIRRKVELEEAEGWRVFRRNAKSTRIAKEKPADEQLEDEVWSILAQMGFKEMSKGRQFKIAVEEGLPPRQIDVFAKDDEAAVIVECTRREEPGRKRMTHLIDKIKADRRDLIRSIHKAYSRKPKLKVNFVIATRKIAWSDADIEKCREAKITLITDSELHYYSQLTKHLKSAARYQFLAHLFSGQKIEGLKNRVMATRGKMGAHTFFTFLIRPDELLKIAYVGHKASRDIDSLETYQRMLQPIRLKKIAEFINNGGKFPTNIVVNLKTSKLRFDEKERYGEGMLGELYLPATYASAWIIDGQHRLYGYAYAREAGNGFNQDSTLLPVLAYKDLPADEEMNLFIDINSKQVKVRNNLLVELYSDLHWESPNSGEAFQALLSRTAVRLNSDGASPLNNRMVVSGKRKTSSRCLTQISIQAGLREAKLLGTYGNGAITPGPLSTARKDDYQLNLNKGFTVLSDCLRLFSTSLPEHWKLGDHREENRCGYLCTNNGIRAIFLIIKDISDHIEYKNSTKLCYFNAEKTFAEIKP